MITFETERPLPRLTGTLPVRQHLRPRTKKKGKCDAIFIFFRNPSGRFCFDAIDLDLALDFEIEGEA